MKLRILVCTAGASLLLAACGGNDDWTEPVAADDTTVPASATASVAAFNGFVNQQPADETREPLALNGVMPPTSDDDEPAAIR